MGCAPSSDTSREKIDRPNDTADDHGRHAEEADEQLPDGDIGDCCLGITNKTDEIPPGIDANHPYCDEHFPANSSSLFYSKTDSSITWARPKDIVEHPHMLVDGTSTADVIQGNLGDCWFLSSCAAICQNKQLMDKILPDAARQALSGPGYNGLIKIRFWRFGSWCNVFIDDLLPVYDGRRLAFATSKDPNEFWISLVEKAYAKLHGSYEAIIGGPSEDALVDLTGGVAQRINIQSPDKDLYQQLLRTHATGGFITCTKTGTGETKESTGLVSGHAYTITSVAQVRNHSGKHRLLRVRNPWGDDIEWNGAWSDGDETNWKSAVGKGNMHIIKADGEFWMNFTDFCSQFDTITICTLNPDLDGDGYSDAALPVKSRHGKWSARSAGGSRNNIHKFIHNPQFILSIPKADEYDEEFDDPDTKGKCCVVIALMQEHRRSQRHLGVKMLHIGFTLYKVRSPRKVVGIHRVRYREDSGTSGVFLNTREATGRFELFPGHYAIIPSTFDAGETGTFLLRVFAASQFSLVGPTNK